MNYPKKYLISGLALLATSLPAWSQEAPVATFIDSHFNNIVLIILVVFMVVFLFAVIAIFTSLMNMLVDSLPEDKQAKYTMKLVPEIHINWNRISQKLTNAVPIVKEQDILLDHDYDGIRELDNHLPPWWKWMFYATIVWAIGFMGYYYVLGKGKNQYEQYESAMAKAEIEKAEYRAKHANLVDESNVVFQNDPAVLAGGKEVFITNCAACHGELGEGKIGPNLTDDYYIHGNTITDIFKTVKYGITGKMIPWEEMITAKEMSDVSSYVVSLYGTNPPNAKEPQGDLIVVSTTEVDSAAVMQ